MINLFEKYFEYFDGYLIWKQSTNPQKIRIGDLAGAISVGGNGIPRMRVSFFNKSYYNHRIIWNLHYGEIPENMEIDHIDGNPLNNKIENLRLCNRQQNCFNTKSKRTSTSKYKGVSFSNREKCWKAQIQLDGKNYHIGNFKSEYEAHLAYSEVALEFQKEFAKAV